MRTSRQTDHLTLSFNLLECRILRHVLEQIRRNYTCRPEELDPRVASAWYSTRGCKSAGMTAEETQEWVANLREIKGNCLPLLEQWCGQLAAPQEGHVQLRVKLHDAATLLTALNDQRLLAASGSDIGQTEMDLHSPTDIATLPAAQQNALFQIHFLALVMEEILAQLSDGSP